LSTFLERIGSVTRFWATVGRMSRIHDLRLITELIAVRGPVIHLRDVDAAGIPRDVPRRAAERGDLVRVGKAALVARETWEAGNDWDRFGYRSIGFGLSIAKGAYLTGPAAAYLHGVPTLDAPPPLPTAVRPGDAHRAPVRSVHGVSAGVTCPLPTGLSANESASSAPRTPLSTSRATTVLWPV
jgi:hypothetical protein